MGKQAEEGMDRFKETDIGLLPEDWEIVKAGDIFRPINCRLKHLKEDINQVPVLSMTRYNGLILQNKKFEKQVASKDISNYKIVKRGQLVYGFPIDEGVIAILHRYPIGAVSPAYNVWDITKEVDLFYLDVILKHPLLINQYIKLSSNVVHRRRNLSPKDFVNVIVPLPPILEQRKITYVLYTIQRAVEQQDKIIAAARELKKSLMRHLFTYGPVPVDQVGRVPLKETEIGLFPKNWIIVAINEIGEVITGTTPKTSKPDYYGSPYPFISPGDITESKYVIKTGKCLSEQGIQVSRPLPCNTVLVVCIGATIGKTAMTAAKLSATNQQINAIIPNDNVYSHYLYYVITWRSSDLLDWAGRAAVPIVNKSNFMKFPIPLPPLSEQRQIAHILSMVDKKIEVEEKRKASLQSLFQTMLHLLMTGKVRVRDLEVKANDLGI